MITLVERGDLLSDDAEALVNPVNCVGVMGKGLAAQFRRNFPGLFAAYVESCREGQVRVGFMHVYAYEPPVGDPGGRSRIIINFPTKDHWRNPSRLAWIEDGMLTLVAVVHALRLKSLAIPALGCGEGGLAWEDVRPLIVGCFEDSAVDVRLYAPG